MPLAVSGVTEAGVAWAHQLGDLDNTWMTPSDGNEIGPPTALQPAWKQAGGEAGEPGLESSGGTAPYGEGQAVPLGPFFLAYQKGQDVLLMLLGLVRKIRHLVLLTQFMLLLPLHHIRPLVLLPQLILLNPLLHFGHLVLPSLG